MVLDNLQNINARYLVAADSLWFSEIIKAIKDDQKELGLKIKTRILGNFALTVGRLINPEINHIMPFVE